MKYCTLLLLLLLSCKQSKEVPSLTSEQPSTVSQKTIQIPEVEKNTIVLSKEIVNNDDILVNGHRHLRDVEVEIKRHLITTNYWFSKSFPNEKNSKTVVVSFEISPLGVAQNVQLIETDCESSFTERIIQDIPRWRFIRINDSLGNTKVQYPITLRPAKPVRL